MIDNDINIENSDSIICAITGGIGSGKSSVAKIIKNKGYPVISSDDNAKDIMTNNPEVKKNIISAFGTNSFLPSGEINKDFISGIAFGRTTAHETALNKLNSIVHPVVIGKMIEEVERLINEGKKLIFVESALTFEAALEDGFDYIIVVDAREDLSIERVTKRSGLTEDEVKIRMEQQIQSDIKKQHADFVIENNGDLKQLENSVDFVLSILTQMTD